MMHTSKLSRDMARQLLAQNGCRIMSGYGMAAVVIRTFPEPRRTIMFHGLEHSARAFAANLDRLVDLGFSLTKIDFDPFEEAGRLVFQSAMVAERLCDYGDVIANRRDAIHPAVWAAIEPGLGYSARDAFQTLYELKRLQRI